ncbi:MAG: hypothetical protein GY708_29130, partial [Actinomycetia bacterium]|nr:hypothetical protein [Actinomycetes bacterium]
MPNPDNGTHLGTGGNSGGQFNFYGLIDDAQVYNTALDDAGVRSLMGKIPVTHVIAGNLIIESESQGIGTRPTPISFDLSGELTVSSGSDANLASLAPPSSPLQLNTAFVNGTLRMHSLGGIIDANDTTDSSGNQLVAVTNVIADEVFFEADTVGTQANPIEIDSDGVDPPSLGGNIRTRMDVAAEDAVLVTNLGGQGATYAVTAQDDLLLGLVNDGDGTVVFESINGSILN